MKKITVSGQSGYEILINSGEIANAGEHIRPLTFASRAVIVTDSNVRPLYGKIVENSLKAAGFEVSFCVFPAGEPSKNIDTVSSIIEAFCNANLTRADIAVALGGGVVGDLTGFAAAIYLRGIDFVQIPTTLLSQVDSSVGGKTGCDLSFGKNLIGAFHNPRLVIIDPDTLSTLPERYMRDGMGEVIKYGVISSAELFARLEEADGVDEDIIYSCVDIKRGVVERDFTEKGERMHLNFGHTLAHAIEKHYNFEGISHGEAVGVGMYEISLAAEKEGFTEKGTAERIKKLLERYSLPTKVDVESSALVDIMLHDKKRRADYINLVLAEKIGKAYTKQMKTSFLEGFFKKG